MIIATAWQGISELGYTVGLSFFCFKECVH